MEIISSSKQLKQYLNNEFSVIRKTDKMCLPVSKYFGEIGSTETEDIPYKKQLEVKLKAAKSIFSNILCTDLLDEYTIVASPQIFEYRLKMEFVCSHNPIHKPHDRLGQRKKGNFSWVVDMHECNLIDNSWFQKLRQVYEFLKKEGLENYDLKTTKGNLRYTNIKVYNNEAMIILMTKEKVDDLLTSKVSLFALELGFKGIYWASQNSLGDLAFGEIYAQFGQKLLQVDLNIEGKRFNFSIGPFSFFQNNIKGFEKLLNYVASEVDNVKKEEKIDTLIDLFCGVGTIGICLSRHFKKIIGVDIGEDNISLIDQNLNLNKIKNYEYHIGDVRKFQFSKYKSPLVIIDPPRTGLEERGAENVLSLDPKVIVYISCNPITQRKDLDLLVEKYTIRSVRAFDLFPHTYHMENVIVLERA